MYIKGTLISWNLSATCSVCVKCSKIMLISVYPCCRSALKKLYERDDAAGKLMVLCVSDIIHCPTQPELTQLGRFSKKAPITPNSNNRDSSESDKFKLVNECKFFNLIYIKSFGGQSRRVAIWMTHFVFLLPPWNGECNFNSYSIWTSLFYWSTYGGSLGKVQGQISTFKVKAGNQNQSTVWHTCIYCIYMYI